MWYDMAGQAERRRLVNRKLAAYTLDYFDAEGGWIGEEDEPRLRERLWYALGYMESGEEAAVRAANRIVAASTFSMCHFTPMAALQLLLRYSSRLEPRAAEALSGYLSGILDSFTGEALDFWGANDNYPTMSTYIMLAGGILFKRPDYTAIGMKRLGQLQALLTRRGFTSEYNSPTYTPIQAYCLAEIAELPIEPEARHTALRIEERLWVDLWSHYHPTTYQTAGPYSRAYAVDSTAHTHQSRFVLYALIGDRLAINPMNTVFATKFGKAGELIHNNAPFMQVSVSWLLHATYHCPPKLVEHGLNKTYPYRVQGTYEYSSATDGPQPPDPEQSDDVYDIPAGSGIAKTYMTEDYALGVGSRDFRTGSCTDLFNLLYRRRPVTEQRDIATVYANYMVGDKRPGQLNDYQELNWRNWVDSVLDEGRKIGFMHERTAMLLYKPKIVMNRQVTSLRLSLLFSARYGFVEEVWLGEKKLEQLEGQSMNCCPVFVKDGQVYMAFFPLLFNDYEREAAVKVEKVNEYLTVSFYNYEGPAKDFAKRGLLLTGNGFVAEVGSEAEDGSFESFRSRLANARVLEEWAHGNHLTHMRRTVYEREGLRLECVWNPISEGIKLMTVNGRIPPEPMLAIDGLDTGELPFVNE